MIKKIFTVKNCIIVGVLVVIALLSFFALSSITSSPDFHKNSIKLLDEKKMTVANMTGAAAAASTIISAIPGDATTPIANEIMDVASYLLIITGVIFLEKMLLTLTGLIAFKYLIPISCILGIIYVFWKKEVLKNLAIKLTVFGLLIYLVVPTSIYLSSWIENNYKSTINVSIESVEEIGIEEQAAEEETNKNEGLLQGIMNNAQKVAEKVTSSVSDGVEKAKQILSSFIDATAVLIITSCVIPVLVIIFFVWIIKIVFGIDVSSKKALLKHKDEKKEIAQE